MLVNHRFRSITLDCILKLLPLSLLIRILLEEGSKYTASIVFNYNDLYINRE